MPLGPGGNDANGIYKYGESDTRALFSDLLNLLATSVSTKIGTMVGQITSLLAASLVTTGTATPAAGHTIGASTRIRKSNGLVNVNLTVGNASTLATNVVVATLPSGFRPPAQMVFAFTQSNATIGMATVLTNGQVRINFVGTGSTSGDCNMSFPAA